MSKHSTSKPNSWIDLISQNYPYESTNRPKTAQPEKDIFFHHKKAEAPNEIGHPSFLRADPTNPRARPDR